MKNTDPEHIARVLADINSRIPANLRKNVVREVKLTPTMEFVVDKLLDSKNKKIKPELRKQAQILKDAGQFNKTKLVENPKIAKLIDDWTGREINKAIKAGQLPPKSKMGDIPGLKEMYDRVKANGDAPKP